jgi:hypothetical protein
MILVSGFMPRQTHLVVPIRPDIKAELDMEAWECRLTLAAYVRQILERSKTPDGRQRVWTKMRKRGRPKR